MSKSNGNYQLKHFSFDGTLKNQFPEGRLKANSEVVFFIINGWYSTVITKVPHKLGDSARYVGLINVESAMARSVVEHVLSFPATREHAGWLPFMMLALFFFGLVSLVLGSVIQMTGSFFW